MTSTKQSMPSRLTRPIRSLTSAAIGLCAIIAVCATTAWGQTPPKIPNIGCVYPAGGQRGKTIRIVVNGQNISGPRALHVTGGGVSAEGLQYARLPRNLQKEQRNLVTAKLKEINDQIQAEKSGRKPNPKLHQATVARMEEYLVRYPPKGKAIAAEEARKKAGKPPEIKLPNCPALYGLEEMSPREMAHAQYEIFFPNAKKQLNPQLAEVIILELTIDADADVGDRELRIESALGVSNPIVFQVGVEPEFSELEPNDPKPWGAPNLPPPSDLPMVFNGRIMVDQDAQKTNANQANRNLLLSDDAVVNSNPQLEIFADDVRCTHGSTVGRLDDEAIFYLRSRGIGREDAHRLLTLAFAGEILDRVPAVGVRNRLEEVIARRLTEISRSGEDA